MKAQGNGKPEVCATNLLRIARGEIPYDRVRGRDSTLVDRPNCDDDAVADAQWLLETYEPRVNVENVMIDVMMLAEGNFVLSADISRRENENE